MRTGSASSATWLPPPWRSWPPRATAAPGPFDDDPDLHLVDDDGLALVAPHDEVFHRLYAAIDQLGHVSYADEDQGYIEAVLPSPAGANQLVVSLQGRAMHTEAFFTLEPMGNHLAPPIDAVVRSIARLVRSRR